MSRLKTITFATESGGEQTLTVQDYDSGYEIEYYGQPSDEAIDGSLRQNVRGQRQSVSVSYKLCGDPDQFRSICNNIAQDLRDGQEFFYVGIDSGNLIRVTLDGDLSYLSRYKDQHGVFVPKLNMTATELGLDISVEVQDWRFIDEAVTDFRDYGLITETVDTQIDYGSI